MNFVNMLDAKFELIERHDRKNVVLSHKGGICQVNALIILGMNSADDGPGHTYNDTCNGLNNALCRNCFHTDHIYLLKIP